MRKLVILSIIGMSIISCSNLKKDAQTIADFQCLSYDNYGDKSDRYDLEIDKIKMNYSGSDLIKLEKETEIFYQKCPKKIAADKKEKEIEKEMKQYEIETKKRMNSNENSKNNYQIDKIINEYEDYMDSYLNIYKNALPGEINFDELSELEAKAQVYQNSLDKIENDPNITAEQLQRINKLNMKYIDLMMN